MSESQWRQCPARYSGPSYPNMHGTQCELEAGHDNHKGNAGRHHGGGLSWLSAEQKSEFDRSPDGPVLP